ncbi:phosphoenolpyruvate--protein phosphotransferase [Candidatus Tokpelaia sp.]|uniref:phosphoenolpyruvate--protein phosphotransferase n=1 Tax=Candidatus Tokpelaia sp. TaxID=2233777 RepID=UPI00123C1131|nr:phosphoenolpyruvate--protein phosphotransferase [Candidatus Tokpelaia sp.]KAA6406238.1 phosphoenolpyruvate--protein phosphotransferase [Candidatus Tokpelaia sp.]
MPAIPDSTLAATAVEEALIRLNAAPRNREEAIRAVGQILVEAGAVEPPYIESMLRRETQADTWLGSGIAIPHGMIEDKHYVRADKVAVLQVPQGVEWSQGETAYLVFGIAARGDGHLAVLRRLTGLLQQPQKLPELFTTHDPAAIGAALSDPAGEAAAAEAPAHDLAEIALWRLDYPNGLHARPASLWIEAAKQADAPLQVRLGNQVSDIKSLISLLQLGAKCGDELSFSAGGEQAAQKLAALIKAVKALSAGEKQQAHQAAEQQAKSLAKSWQPPSGQAPIIGVPAAPGLSVGIIYHSAGAEPEIEDRPLPPAQSGLLLQQALEKTRQQMQAVIDDITRRLGRQEAGIFKAQADLLNDDELITKACRLILAGRGAARAWAITVREAADRLAGMDNPILAGRATDLRDIGKRVLANMAPAAAANPVAALPKGEKLIIVAEDLSPSDTAALDTAYICGLATIAGGPSSHSAILARTIGLPAIAAAGKNLAEVPAGTKAILNGDSGALWLDPAEEDIAAARAEIARIKAGQQRQAESRRLPATTPDGHNIIIAANINRPDQAAFALDQGAEAVGLMRTEFLFLERDSAPDEEEQYHIYRAMLSALGSRPLIIRALDIGGDKQVAYLNLPREDNPFLGRRGARLLLHRPDLLYPQLRAIYRAAAGGGAVSIMFPMITMAEEIIRLKDISETIRQSLNAPPVPLGIMVEVPAAAIEADKLAAYADFFSIGTNDLTQYTLAMDRQNPDLAAKADSLHPAVLRLIKRIVAGARRYRRFVGVCGGLAADPFGAVLLAGLGVDELSMTPRDIAAVKAQIRRTPLGLMRDLARQACLRSSAAEVRALDKGLPADKPATAETAAPATQPDEPGGKEV